jgi:DUF177 domain-containing protein
VIDGPRERAGTAEAPIFGDILSILMLLDLSTIRTAHEHVGRAFEPSAFADDAEYRVVAPVRLALDVYKDHETFRLVGRVQSTIELRCSRCLEPFLWTVDEPFELTYVPQRLNAGVAEREIADEDFSSAFYQNDEIDLEQLIRERFEMSMPMKPLCRVDCSGLCAVCGTNLNLGSCTCKVTWGDPRLAALDKLKIER